MEPEDFYHEFLRDAYRWAVEQRTLGNAIDIGLMAKQFKTSTAKADIGEVMQSVPHTGHAKHYARKIKKLAGFRETIRLATDALQTAYEAEGNPEDLLDSIEMKLVNMKTSPGENEPVTSAEAAIAAIEHLDNIRSKGEEFGVPTGVRSYDRDQGGMFPGELTILAARPGCGKSSLAMQIAFHNASKGRFVYFSSLEMSATELAVRLACGHAGVSNRLVRTNQLTDEHMSQLSEALQGQAHAKMVIHDPAKQTIGSIRRQVHKRAKNGLKLVVVDYLQLLTSSDSRMPREQQVAQQVRGMKAIARDYEVPVLCLCQLNRQISEGEVPSLNHLRESGSIEQDADVVWFLSKNLDDDMKGQYNTVWQVAKNRNGETGPLRLNFDGPRTCFEGVGGVVKEWDPDREF